MSDTGSATVFRDVRVFDSRGGRIVGPSQVLVRGATIETVAPAGAALPAAEHALVLEGRGRTLMPGLIDAHWHAVFAAVPLTVALSADPAYLHLLAGKTATETLLRGFTTVRDLGGPSFGLKRAIDSGVLPGPRIFRPARLFRSPAAMEISGCPTRSRAAPSDT